MQLHIVGNQYLLEAFLVNITSYYPNIIHLIIVYPLSLMKTLISQIVNSSESFNHNFKTSQLFAVLSKNKANLILKFGSSLKPTSSPVCILKWLMLIHKMLLQEFRLDEWLYQKIDEIAFTIQCKSQCEADKKIQRIIPCYLQYIKKRCMNFPKWVRNDPSQQSYEDQIQYCFEILNIIRNATTFNQIYYTFGRYFQSQYPLIEDFNILMAKDIKQLYNLMALRFDRLWKLNQKGVSIDSSVDEVYLLHIQIQALNESLNYLYYNIYYVDLVKKYTPNWVRLELNRKRKSSKDSTKSSDELEGISRSIQRLKTQIYQDTHVPNCEEVTLEDISKQLMEFMRIFDNYNI